MEGRGQRAGNVMARALLRTPLLHRLVSDRLLIITVRGRRTGKRYRVPVGYVGVDGRFLVGAAGNWTRNMRSDEPVDVVVRGRVVPMLPQLIDDMDMASGMYGAIIRHNPVHGRFAKIRLDADGQPDRDDLAAAWQRGVRVVRLQPCGQLG